MRSRRAVMFSLGAGMVLLLASIGLVETRVESPLREPAPAPLTTANPRPPANPLRSAYFGELHLHTALSPDASVFGVRGGPRSAYRFARGDVIEIPISGAKRQLTTPLDFAVVTDHAEGMGVIHQCHTPDSGSYWSPKCFAIRHPTRAMFAWMFRSVRQEGTARADYDEAICGPEGRMCTEGAVNVWQEIQAAADDYYEPGVFTTFKAFEFSPTLAEGGMLHRNVIFRGTSVPRGVFSAQDGFAEDLLRWIEANCREDCQALSIPHNSNFSRGMMFGDVNSDGTPLTRENAELRSRIETSVEIFQAKGSSECAAGIGNDEECGFENLWPACSAEDAVADAVSGQHAARCVAEGDLVRSALRKGLLLERSLGVNPFRFGFVAATDNHNAAPGDTDESRFDGHSGSNDATPQKRLGLDDDFLDHLRERRPAVINPGGLTGVWAEENTRESIWDAIKRRETFGTSGTRIRVRMFGGFDLPADLHTRTDGVAVATAAGVPMGGELVSASEAAPSFVIWALQDPGSAPLQRIQIVKGWVQGEQSAERVWDVACSDGLLPDSVTGRCPDNGASVDLGDCSITAGKGAAELATTWTDPSFDPAQAAFYYVRVLENPVCRYSQRDALAVGVRHPESMPQTIQERAWSSPIWFRPAQRAR